MVVRLRDPAKFERNTAQDKAEQHHEDRHMQRRHQDRIGQRKRNEQAASAENQPCLVAVPERRYRIHHLIALGFDPCCREQDADAEVESVEDDIHDDSESEQKAPHDREMGFHRITPPVATRWPRSLLPGPLRTQRKSAGLPEFRVRRPVWFPVPF
jgi:hypothetical protein